VRDQLDEEEFSSVLASSMLAPEDVQRRCKLDQTGSFGLSPLSIASKMASVRMVRLLLLAGAQPNLLSSVGIAPMHVAAGFGTPSMMELLVSHGGDLSLSDEFGRSVSWFAQAMHNTDVALWLTKQGLNAAIPTRWMTPERDETLSEVWSGLEGGTDENLLSLGAFEGEEGSVPTWAEELVPPTTQCEIATEETLDPRAFYQRYVVSGIPVRIRGSAPNGQALQDVQRRFGQRPVIAGPVPNAHLVGQVWGVIRLGDFLEYSANPTAERLLRSINASSSPIAGGYSREAGFGAHSSQLLEWLHNQVKTTDDEGASTLLSQWDHASAPFLVHARSSRPFFRDLVPRLPFLSNDTLSTWSAELVLGGRLSGLPMQARTDAVHTSVHGRQLWGLLPPDSAAFSASHASRWWSHERRSSSKWQSPLVCVAEPGDTLFVPTRWSASSLHLDTGASVTQELRPAMPFLSKLEDVAEALGALGGPLETDVAFAKFHGFV
jgi:hypothetical protein